MTKNVLTTGLVSAVLVAGSGLLGTAKSAKVPVFTRVWTHGHTTPGQLSEIPAFDARTNTVWVAGVVGVDVLDAETGALVEHIDVTPWGFVNSVAIHNGLAAFAVEASPDRRAPGRVVFFDTRTRQLSDGVSEVTVGALPDMLTFTPDGSKLLVANEATPNAVADTAYTPLNDPEGTVTIIDMETRTVLATAGLLGVPISGNNVRTNVGMDFEPESIAVTKDGTKAYVTLQEANAVGELDLTTNAFTRILGLGAKDFSSARQRDRPEQQRRRCRSSTPRRQGPVHAGRRGYLQIARASTFMALANEGDFREDNVDRSPPAATVPPRLLPSPRFASSIPPSSSGNVFAAGARSFSIRDADGAIVYDSGSILDREANRRGVYDDSRSRDKGVEPEGITLLEAKGRTYAFVGLERTLKRAVAVFDVTSPYDVRFLDMIVTDGDVSPEGLAVYHYRGTFYLAIANEIVAPRPDDIAHHRVPDRPGEGRRGRVGSPFYPGGMIRTKVTQRPGARAAPGRIRRYRSGMNARPLLAFIGITSWLAPAS